MAMKQYEIMTISKLTAGEDGAREVSNQIKDTITGLKGKVIDSDFWGKRNFSYEINGQTEGYYDIINFDLSPDKVSELKRKLNLMDDLVRYLVTAA